VNGVELSWSDKEKITYNEALLPGKMKGNRMLFLLLFILFLVLLCVFSTDGVYV